MENDQKALFRVVTLGASKLRPQTPKALGDTSLGVIVMAQGVFDSWEHDPLGLELIWGTAKSCLGLADGDPDV